MVNNVLFWPYKPCRKCLCVFTCSSDYESHVRDGQCGKTWLNDSVDSFTDVGLNSVKWTPYRNNSGEWAFQRNVPGLVSALRMNGHMDIGMYTYRLSGDTFVSRNVMNYGKSF